MAITSLVSGLHIMSSGISAFLLQTIPSLPAWYAYEAPPGYKLVFQDTFSKDGAPDPNVWSYSQEGNQDLWWHNERQYYTNNRRENARVEKGNLIIEARREQLKGLPGWVGQEYTSARLVTRKKKSFQYGYFDIRAKLACGLGAWPAFWMMGESPKGAWPKDGEIDIMEHVGHTPNVIYGSIHNNQTYTQKLHLTKSLKIRDACNSFNRYQMVWTPYEISFYVNGVLYHTQKKDGRDYNSWPYDHTFHLIFNIAVGGAWGGQKGIAPTAFPTRMEIDYVKVYQKASY